MPLRLCPTALQKLQKTNLLRYLLNYKHKSSFEMTPCYTNNIRWVFRIFSRFQIHCLCDMRYIEL